MHPSIRLSAARQLGRGLGESPTEEFSMTQATKRVRTVVAAVLTALIGLMLTLSAALKLFALSPLPGQMETWGLGGWRVVIGLGERASAALFVIPRTAELGTLLLSAYLGG